MSFLLTALFAAWALFASSQAEPCRPTGTLVLEQPGSTASAPVLATATVDAQDPACRELARKEPFLIIKLSDGSTSEVALTPAGAQFRGEFPLPQAPFAAQLYADGFADVLATTTTVKGQFFELPSDLSWLRRSEGALLVALAAVGLGLVSLIGLPAGGRRR